MSHDLIERRPSRTMEILVGVVAVLLLLNVLGVRVPDALAGGTAEDPYQEAAPERPADPRAVLVNDKDDDDRPDVRAPVGIAVTVQSVDNREVVYRLWSDGSVDRSVVSSTGRPTGGARVVIDG